MRSTYSALIHRVFTVCTTITAILLLTSCSELPVIIPQSTTASAAKSDLLSLPSDQQIEQANALLAAGNKIQAASVYFEAANNFSSPYRERLILQAAELASISNDRELTQRYLAPISNIPLNPENQARFRFAQAQLAINDRNYPEALRLLPQRVNSLPEGLAYKILKARLSTAQSSGDKLILVQELVLQEPTLKNTYEKELNQDRIWGHIQQMPLQQINDGRSNTSHPTLKGWLDLAYLSKTRNISDSQQDQIKTWQNTYPDHPANKKLNELFGNRSVATTSTYQEKFLSQDGLNTTPDDNLSYSSNSSNNKLTENKNSVVSANNISVILPLSGKLSSVGNTILAGIKEAQTNNTSNTSASKSLKIYDANSGDIGMLYQTAIRQGASIVIGPFDKTRLATLSTKELPVTTLGLNFLENNKTGKTTNNLYQFGLSPEDEAVQMANYAISLGKKRVAILTPDSLWGKRLNEALRTSVIERGGKVTVNKSYANSEVNYSYISQSISSQSDQIDVILLAASPSQAQRIYPALRQALKDMPIFATSHVFSGKVNTGADANLEGLMFTESPWILDKLSNDSAMPSSYPRLYALGMDAMMLASRLDELKGYSNTLEGKTGRIRLSRDGTLHRELAWARFSGGKPVYVSR